MPRRKRGFGAGGACCHITQRCVNGEYLLKFKRDRRNYLQRMSESLSRHSVLLLNHVITSNHTHLLVWSERASEISALMQYLSGASAQDYNRRKKRHGTYWGDRYHVTLVQSGTHLARCLFYIDMNMVRASVVSHPCEWETGGCRELMGQPVDLPLIDQTAVVRLLSCGDMATFQRWHANTLTELCAREQHDREPWWTEAVAVGDRSWIAPLADRFAIATRSVHQVASGDGPETWTMGMSRRRREAFLASLDRA